MVFQFLKFPYDMQFKDVLGIIPPHESGKKLETVAKTAFPSIVEAAAHYSVVKRRLLLVNGWHKIAGTLSAKFQLITPDNKEGDREAQVGDYLRITIPGPACDAGEGYDWVQIEALQQFVEEDTEAIGFRVRPCVAPFNNSNQTAHFYDADACSCFIVMRLGTEVVAWILERNLTPNDEAENVKDKIREIVVGLTAIAVGSKIQWKSLADGLIT